jgi:phosphate:Na+ symporter
LQHLLLEVFGGVALLLWATRMVRTGVMRAAGERLRGLIAAASSHLAWSCLAGTAAAAALQSATAAALLVTSFLERELIRLGPALAVLLGAHLGSTLVVQALAFDLRALAPFLMIVGVAAFMLSNAAHVRQYGRIVIGLALMILALELIVHASAPLRSNWLLLVILQRLEGEPLLALALGAGLTWLFHSSVATVLLLGSLASAGVLEPRLAVTLVLGANLGSALIPIGLNLRAGPPVRRLLFGYLFIVALGALAALPLAGLASQWLGPSGGGRLVANAHTVFNLALIVLALPFVGLLARALPRFVPDQPVAPGARSLHHLDDSALDRPAVALSGATREVLRLAETVEVMLREAILPFEAKNAERRGEIKQLDSTVDALQEQIKLYLIRLTRNPLGEEDSRRAFDLILFTTNLEHVGDIIDKNLLELAAKKQRLGLSFSQEGWAELQRLHALAVDHMRLAVTVFVTRDVAMARQLVEAKDEVRAVERRAAESHLQRLREGTIASLETSSVHLDVLRDLKQIIAHLTSVAHPILEAHGEIRASRLKAPEAEAPAAERPVGIGG